MICKVHIELIEVPKDKRKKENIAVITTSNVLTDPKLPQSLKRRLLNNKLEAQVGALESAASGALYEVRK
jgi:hypothetical protein